MPDSTAQDRRRVKLLAGVLAGDVVFDVVAHRWVQDDLDRLGVPHSAIPLILAAKTAGAAGLAIGLRRSRVGMLASAGLVLYFLLAVAAHGRARDEAWRYGPALVMLAASALVLRIFRRRSG